MSDFVTETSSNTIKLYDMPSTRSELKPVPLVMVKVPGVVFALSTVTLTTDFGADDEWGT